MTNSPAGRTPSRMPWLWLAIAVARLAAKAIDLNTPTHYYAGDGDWEKTEYGIEWRVTPA